VTGCLGVNEEQIRIIHPQVLSISGPQQYDQVVDAVIEHLPLKDAHNPLIDLIPPQGVKLTPEHYAYLKISEGCNHHCSFCIIPSMRGRLVSRMIDDVMSEAQDLVNAGVKELLIISQDTSAYGSDLKYRSAQWNDRIRKSGIYDLSEALSELGVWIRLHYVYPYPHIDQLIPLMAEGKILPYLDVPFQHGSARILKLMRRPAAAEDNLTRLQQWREICPDLVIRSTFIVGFPGETEDDFEQLLDFLRAARLDRVGCFKYSHVDGARANDLPGFIPEDIKQERYERLMETQMSISRKKLQDMVGRTLEVIIDKVDNEVITARSHADAPEIDGNVFVRSALVHAPGDIIDVHIETSGDYDLWGKTILPE
jgi:ribosomal protein S12 methylthiotransferase